MANKNRVKPPVGYMPTWLWLERRLNEIGGAIHRYVNANKAIPDTMIADYNSVLAEWSRWRNGK